MCVSKEEIYLVGGKSKKHERLNTFDTWEVANTLVVCYDSKTDRYTQRPHMVIDRCSPSVAWDNETRSLIIVGGLGSDKIDPDEHGMSSSPINSYEIYEIDTGKSKCVQLFAPSVWTNAIHCSHWLPSPMAVLFASADQVKVMIFMNTQYFVFSLRERRLFLEGYQDLKNIVYQRKSSKACVWNALT